MDFLKRQAFFLICGVVGLAGIALGVTGMSKMSAIQQEMTSAARIAGELNALRSSPANERFIEAEKSRIDKILASYDEVMAKVHELSPYKPLLPELFPGLPEGKKDRERELRIDFRRQYQTAFQETMDLLNSGRPADEQEITEAQKAIELETKSENPLGTEADGDAVQEYTKAGVLTRAGARLDPVARANLQKAQGIYCYAEPYNAAVPTLEFNPQMVGDNPLDVLSMFDCWDAQVELWIQNDILSAIARLNNEAASRLLADQENPWVGVLPVKDVISLRISSEYISAPEQPVDVIRWASPIGIDAAHPPGVPDASFNYRVSDETFDVLQFTLKVVMDERELPALIREISANRFHTLLHVAYVAQVPNPAMQGKIYGSQPTIKVVLDFETHMLGDIYRQWMPDEVLEYYSLERPAEPTDDSEEG